MVKKFWVVLKTGWLAQCFLVIALSSCSIVDNKADYYWVLHSWASAIVNDKPVSQFIADDDNVHNKYAELFGYNQHLPITRIDFSAAKDKVIEGGVAVGPLIAYRSGGSAPLSLLFKLRQVDKGWLISDVYQIDLPEEFVPVNRAKQAQTLPVSFSLIDSKTK